jgi:hypothetical protein
VAFLGGSDVLYAGISNIYLANTAETSQGETFTITSSLTRVGTENGVLSFAENITLPGIIDGPEFMSESAGILHVVAPSFSYTESSGIEEADYTSKMQIFVIDEMEIVDTLDDFEEGQDLFDDYLFETGQLTVGG